jgi:UDPglucose 6-dehydrogenase
MRVAVIGLSHLGSVISACLADKGHDVVGIDQDQDVIRKLSSGKAPVYEPQLDELIKVSLSRKKLRFSSISQEVLRKSEVVWIAHDTPVDDNDIADVDFVNHQIKEILPLLSKNTLILVSSQLPVGSIKFLEDYAEENVPFLELKFACSPENLRLGQAIDVFNNPDRVVIGVRCQQDKIKLSQLIFPITKNVEWMSIESAEMTKHAINAFLATSIVFANELASICEAVGANAKEVERGMKTEARIGPEAYVSAGGPFAGGTLARDIRYLSSFCEKYELLNPVLTSVLPSNDEHKSWIKRKLSKHFGDISGKNIGVWGLTYKPGTNTLRRSASIELCDWILAKGGRINVYDPAVEILPKKWGQTVKRCSSSLEVLRCSEALIVATEWPEFREIKIDFTSLKNKNFAVFDANGFLNPTITRCASHYYSVGVPVFS